MECALPCHLTRSSLNKVQSLSCLRNIHMKKGKKQCDEPRQRELSMFEMELSSSIQLTCVVFTLFLCSHLVQCLTDSRKRERERAGCWLDLTMVEVERQPRWIHPTSESPNRSETGQIISMSDANVLANDETSSTLAPALVKNDTYSVKVGSSSDANDFYKLGFVIPLGICLLSLSLLTLLGNAMVVHVIRTERKLRTVRDALLCGSRNMSKTFSLAVGSSFRQAMAKSTPFTS